MSKKKYTEQEIEIRRKIALALYLLMFIWMFIIIFAMFILKPSVAQLTVMFIPLVAFFGFATALKLHIQPYLSHLLIDKVAEKVDKLEYSEKAGIPEKYFRQANFISKYAKYNSFDFIAGKINEKDFLFSGISIKDKLKTTTSGELTTIFYGTFGITDFIMENPTEIIIAPDVRNKFLNMLLEDIKKATGKSTEIVRLENPEFERYFEVYSQDQVTARKVITLTFMEKMVEFRKLMNKNITLIYKNNKIYFFVESKLILDTRKLFFQGVTSKNVEEATKFFELISEIVNRNS